MTNKKKLRRPPMDTPALYGQDGLGYEAIVYAHYFIPGTCMDWYATEYGPDDDIIFGWAEIHAGCGELGYTSLVELDDIAMRVRHYDGRGELVGNIPYRVEFDRYWTKCSLREAIANR